MNRYQFEDSISDYLENKLNLSQRKEFEAFLEENHDASELVNSIRINLEIMKKIPPIQVNKGFNERLLVSVKKKAGGSNEPVKSKGLILGFKPIQLTVLTGLIFMSFFTSFEIFNYFDDGGKTNLNFSNPLETRDKSDENKLKEKAVNQIVEKNDSTSSKNLNNQNIDYSKNIKFVKD